MHPIKPEQARLIYLMFVEGTEVGRHVDDLNGNFYNENLSRTKQILAYFKQTQSIFRLPLQIQTAIQRLISS
jgi:hypothetical protein